MFLQINMKINYIGAYIINTVTLAAFMAVMLTVSCSKSPPDPPHQVDASQTNMSTHSAIIESNTNQNDNLHIFNTNIDISPTVVKLEAMELFAEKPYQFSLGNGRGFTITAVPNRQMLGRIAVKLTLLTTNTSVSMKHPHVETETLETTLLAGQPNILSLDGTLYVLQVKLKEQ